jgi:hypothetical protein
MINTNVSISRKATNNTGVPLFRGQVRGTDFGTKCSKANSPKITNLQMDNHGQFSYKEKE